MRFSSFSSSSKAWPSDWSTSWLESYLLWLSDDLSFGSSNIEAPQRFNWWLAKLPYPSGCQTLHVVEGQLIPASHQNIPFLIILRYHPGRGCPVSCTDLTVDNCQPHSDRGGHGLPSLVSLCLSWHLSSHLDCRLGCFGSIFSGLTGWLLLHCIFLPWFSCQAIQDDVVLSAITMQGDARASTVTAAMVS